MLVIIGKTPDFRSNFRNTVARNILDNKRKKKNGGMREKKKKIKKIRRENENGTITMTILFSDKRVQSTSTQSIRYLCLRLRVQILANAIIRIVIVEITKTLDLIVRFSNCENRGIVFLEKISICREIEISNKLIKG